MFAARSTEKEIIDLEVSLYTQAEYFDCLDKLGRVGRFLGGHRASFRALSKVRSKSLTILDVGCGGGHFALALARRYPEGQVVGIDINPLAIEYAKKMLSSDKNHPRNVRFDLKEKPELTEGAKSYDIVTSMLVCHHLDDEVIVDFLKRACRVARKRVIINDLHRSFWGYYAFRAISPLLFPNRLINHDGPLSVRRAFTRSDWEKYTRQAGLDPIRVKISWCWAFRYVVEIDVE